MKSFTELGFKDGDTVVCTSTIDTDLYNVGDKFDLVKNGHGAIVSKDGGFSGTFGAWEKVKPESKFYEEIVTKKAILNRNYVTTDLPSGSKFVTSGGSECVAIVGDSWIRNSDIPTIIEHLQQWYDAVQLEKGNEG